LRDDLEPGRRCLEIAQAHVLVAEHDVSRREKLSQ
jgi:hypothetical protein